MFKLREYWDVMTRRKWGIIVSVVFSLGAAIAFCTLSQKMYRSETLILVEEQRIADQYVQGVAEGNLEQRIFVIQKQIMSSSLLRKIVEDLNLFPDEMERSGPDAAVARVKSGIKVELVAKMPGATLVAGKSSIDALTISFQDEDPHMAMRVTSAIATAFIEENLKTREHLAEATTEFLDVEVARAKEALEEKEDEIAQFKSKHMGQLPQQNESNLRALDRLHGDLKAVNENIQRVSDRMAQVEKAIQEYGRFGKLSPTLPGGMSAPDPLFRRLKDLKERLAKLKAEFWDGYPDVPLTREEIRQVEAELMAAYGADAIKAAEKVMDPYLQDLKKQYSEATSELAVLKQRQHSLSVERNDYVNRVEQAPAVEQKLLTLMRDYDNLKGNYLTLGEKRLNARVAENLEKRQKGAQFRILEPANFPRSPYKPNQPLIIFFGLLFGFTIGIGTAVLREQMNPQFQRPEEIEQMLGPQLLAAIPDFMLEFNRVSWRRFFPVRQRLPSTVDLEDEIDTTPVVGRQWIGKSSPDSFLSDGFVVKWLPDSSIAEQYRVAASRLSLIRSNEPSTVLAVTSAVKGEGKTTTVINLGYTMARDLGKRTLLLDCDFKSPMLNRYVETMPKGGLADCLTGDIPLDDCLFEFRDVPCCIMPVGSSSVNSNELLKTGRLSSILSKLRERFEHIFLNTPPIFPLATMNVLAKQADLLVLVVRADSTPKLVVRRALGSLHAVTTTHVILNGVKSQSMPSYMEDYEYLNVKSNKM